MAVVLITGSNTGIGLASALTLGRAGHRVYATMRDLKRSGELAEAVAAEGLPVKVEQMDVTSDSSVANAVEKVYADGLDIDVLVNNAGIHDTGLAVDFPASGHRAIMETNYFGALRCIQAVAPAMRNRGAGCIVNVTSIAGRIAVSPQAAYTASKWALEGLSEVLAQEMKPFNVRVAIVEPGIIDTRMARAAAEGDALADSRERRFAGLFVAALRHPTSPAVVAEKILEIVDSGTWVLRHPVGPDAVPFLDWRNAMTHEQWVDWGALGDEEWYERVERDFGLDARPHATLSLAGGDQSSNVSAVS